MSKKRRLRTTISLVSFACIVCSVILLAVACDLPSSPSGSDWKEYRDARFGYGLMVPSEWKIDIPPETGQAATMSIMNYDPSETVQTGMTDIEWPAGSLKMDFVVIENIVSGTTFEQVIRDNFLNLPYVLTDLIPDTEYGLDQAYVIRFVNNNDPSDSIRSLGAWIDDEKIIVMYLYPETAWDLPSVRDIIGSMALTKKAKIKIPNSPAYTSVDRSAFEALRRNLEESVPSTRDTGDEVGDSPITPLYLPFTDGTAWTVGGVGSYYGEGAHTNGNNDFYAVDWNKGGNGVYQNDLGETLYPVAPGRVIAVRYDKNNIFGGYGNYVMIQHDQGVTTLYGHMSAVFVGKDQDVTINTPIGSVGSTGNSTGPHLHLSFRVNGVSKFATAPSKRPSPVWTTAGAWKLRDGGSATVSKGGIPDETPNPPVSVTPESTPAIPQTCAACIIGNRPDILPFYASNGWNTDATNWDNIIANWCGIDPAGCAAERARCGSYCGSIPTAPPSESPAPAATPGPIVPCSECIIGNRPDILPFYAMNGWDTDRSNWDNIIANWCTIDASGCAAEKAKCGISCGSLATPGPTSPPDSGTCAACVFAHRPDILPFYASNGWNTDISNWDNILTNWCSIDPSGCSNEKAQCGTVCAVSNYIMPTNHAYNALSCTTDSNYDGNFDGNKARDGNTMTKWCSTSATTAHWIKYDLGSVKKIARIVVRHAGSNGEMKEMNTLGFQVKFGTIDNSWVNSVSVNNSNQSNITDINVGPFQARYIMLAISDSGIDDYARIYEFEAWDSAGSNPTDPPVQPTATPVMSLPSNLAFDAISCLTDTNFDGNFDGNKARDGNVTTKWCSTSTTASHWLKYDLGGERTISRIIIRHAGSNGEMQAMNSKNFEVKFGLSDNAWSSTVAVNNSQQAPITDMNVGPYQARFILLHITHCGIDNYARIYEFEVWGTGGSGATAPPSTPTETPAPSLTDSPTVPPPPAPNSLKGAYWLQYDGGYDSYPANVPPVAWNLDYAEMVPNNAAGYKSYYLPRSIKTLVRIKMNLAPAEKQALETLANPTASLGLRFDDWNNQVNTAADALGADFGNLVYAFIFGNEENLASESGISGTAYARAYNAFRAQWNGRGKPLLAAGPGGCGSIGSCTLFFNGTLATIGNVDGFAIHAYGYDEFKNYPDTGGFIDQANTINRVKRGAPIFITEYNIPFQTAQPQNAAAWGKYFNDRYNDVLVFNATHGNQIKALLYFVDAQDHWADKRFGGNTTIVSQDWWNYSLKKGGVVGDGRRDAWKNAPYAPQ